MAAPHYCREEEIRCERPRLERIRQLLLVNALGTSAGALLRRILRKVDKGVSPSLVMPDDVLDPLLASVAAEGMYLIFRRRFSRRKAKLLALFTTIAGRAGYEMLEHYGYKTPISRPTPAGTAKDLAVAALAAAATLYAPALLRLFHRTRELNLPAHLLRRLKRQLRKNLHEKR